MLDEEGGLAVEWYVKINGYDVSSRMNPYIEEIEITQSAGGKSDSARLKFNDKGGQVIMPPKGADVEIGLMGRKRFVGYTDVPESVISRGGGQTLEVACSSFKKTGKAKQALNFHKDDCTLQDFLDEAGKKAEISSVTIDPEFGEIHRPFWSARGRNFLQLGQALADELGGTFKIRGNKAVLAKRGDGKAPGGGQTPTIYITKGVNLIEARIRPYEGRPRYAKARVRRYDRKKAKHVVEDVEIGNDPAGPDVVDYLGEGRPDADSAKRAGKGRKAESEREAGSGSCTILLDVNIEVESPAIVAGIRDAIDGTYRVESFTEKVTRGGAETSVNLKQPQGEAGTDKRGASAKAS